MEQYEFVDFLDFDVINFEVTQMEGEYNLHFRFTKIDDKGEFLSSMIYRTSVFEEDLVQMAAKVEDIIATGVYDHLAIDQDSICFNSEGDVAFEFDWEDYIQNNEIMQGAVQ